MDTDRYFSGVKHQYSHYTKNGKYMTHKQLKASILSIIKYVGEAELENLEVKEYEATEIKSYSILDLDKD